MMWKNVKLIKAYFEVFAPLNGSLLRNRKNLEKGKEGTKEENKTKLFLFLPAPQLILSSAFCLILTWIRRD